MAAEATLSKEDYRSSFKDVVAVLSKLSNHCHTVSDAVGVLELAIKNDAQLRLLMQELEKK